jgi:hypothetical protein
MSRSHHDLVVRADHEVLLELRAELNGRVLLLVLVEQLKLLSSQLRQHDEEVVVVLSLLHTSQ